MHPPVLDQHVALGLDREGKQVPVAEVLGDANSLFCDRRGRGEVPGCFVAEHPRQEQISLLDALARRLDESLSPSEPSSRRADLAPGGEVQADPRRAASCAESLAVLEEPMVRALEPCDRLVVLSEHEGAGRDQFEIRALERDPLVRARQQVVGLEPGAPREGLAALLELVDLLPRPAAHWTATLPAHLVRRRCAAH